MPVTGLRRGTQSVWPCAGFYDIVCNSPYHWCMLTNTSRKYITNNDDDDDDNRLTPLIPNLFYDKPLQKRSNTLTQAVIIILSSISDRQTVFIFVFIFPTSIPTTSYTTNFQSCGLRLSVLGQDRFETKKTVLVLQV